MKKFYVCEGCGCVHEKEDNIFLVNGQEMCTECAPRRALEIPICNFGCQHCYDTCPIWKGFQ